MGPGERVRKGPLLHLHLLHLTPPLWAQFAGGCDHTNTALGSAVCPHQLKVGYFGACSLQQNLFEMGTCLTCISYILATWHWCRLQQEGGRARHPSSFFDQEVHLLHVTSSSLLFLPFLYRCMCVQLYCRLDRQHEIHSLLNSWIS